MQKLSLVSLLVKDYDEAIKFYTQKLGFILEEDTPQSESKRWVIVRPKGSECGLLLARAATERQKESLGNQTGGRVFLFLYTENIDQDYKNLLRHSIEIYRPISEEIYGKVLVFKDLYGNLWDLIEPKK